MLFVFYLNWKVGVLPMRSRKELIIEVATEKAEQSPFMNIYSADDVLIAAGMNQEDIQELQVLKENFNGSIAAYIDRWLQKRNVKSN